MTYSARNPNLWQCLPAEKQHELENDPEIQKIESQLAALNLDSGKDVQDRKKEKQALYAQKKKFLKKQVRKWQRKQPYRPEDPTGYHRELFNRLSFMMPTRKRLSENMFEVADLRSSVGIQVLRDMIALCEQDTNIECRPGLEAERCCHFKDEESKSNLGVGHEDWQHIYSCYKTEQEKVHGVAELCFICHEWVLGEQEWESHCKGHVDNLQSFPRFLVPLLPEGILAMPGFCPFCLTNSKLPASRRMYQFKNKQKWLQHVQDHVDSLDDYHPLECHLHTP
jgi:hypothetical protein